MEIIRQWRNEDISWLRTPFKLTKEQQEKWYYDKICDRKSDVRFWGIEEQEIIHNEIDSVVKPWELIGYGGIENIQWENSIGEISLLISPKHRNKGKGKTAAIKIIREAFDNINLHTVFAECYETNKSIKFWDDIFRGCYQTVLPCKKYSNGIYYNSIYYSMESKHI